MDKLEPKGELPQGLQKIAILGGTFNPIHNGHLGLAQDLVTLLELQVLLLIPCHIPSHRSAPDVNSAERAEMVSIAVGNNEALMADERELVRGGTSYSIDTLIELRHKYGVECSLIFVVGCDAYLGLMDWHRWGELLDYAHIVVAKRPGWEMPVSGKLAEYTRRFSTSIEALGKTSAGSVVLLDTCERHVSSTQIRALVAKGTPIRHLVPEKVGEYIESRGLYRPSV